MNNEKRLYPLIFISIIFFLFIISSTAVVVTAKNASSILSYEYVTNPDNNTVSVIDKTTDNVIATIPVGNYPIEVAVTPDGKKAYVINEYNNSVSVINTAKNKVIKTVKVENNPIKISIDPNGEKVYVGNAGSNSVSIIDTNSDIVKTVKLKIRPSKITFSPDGKKTYITNQAGETTSIIDTSTNHVINTISGGPQSQEQATIIDRIGSQENNTESIKTQLPTLVKLLTNETVISYCIFLIIFLLIFTGVKWLIKNTNFQSFAIAVITLLIVKSAFQASFDVLSKYLSNLLSQFLR